MLCLKLGASCIPAEYTPQGAAEVNKRPRGINFSKDRPQARILGNAKDSLPHITPQTGLQESRNNQPNTSISLAYHNLRR